MLFNSEQNQRMEAWLQKRQTKYAARYEIKVVFCEYPVCQNLMHPLLLVYSQKYCCAACRKRAAATRWYKRKNGEDISRPLEAFELDFLRQLRPYFPTPGVYFIFRNEELQRIGSSSDIPVRRKTYVNLSKKYEDYYIFRDRIMTFEWDHFEYFKCTEANRLNLERRLINYYKPPYNPLKIKS